jgi:ADP-heptose:LPS heptosyltransferase
LLSHPWLDRVFVLPRRELQSMASRRPWHAWGLVSSFISRLRGFAPTRAVDFQGSFKSGLVTRLSGASLRFGFDRRATREASHWFVNRRVALPEGAEHRVRRALALAAAAGGDSNDPQLELGLTTPERDTGRTLAGRLAADRRPLIALAPWSSRRQAWKRYPAERWIEVAAALASQGAAVVVLGGPGEESETASFCAAAGAGVVPSGPLGVRELSALLNACELFVGGDTGPMHIAWAVGCPVVAVFGPTDPRLNAPFGAGHTVLAPPHPTPRHDPDPFRGITPATIVAACSPYLLRPTPAPLAVERGPNACPDRP